ncbi:MAG: PilZ domain-containing protein [Blastocatellia bacterium]
MSSDYQHDNRRLPRVRVNAPAHLAGEESQDALIEARCFSIGSGGFGFILDRQFSPGTWLTVEIDLADGTLHARAVVVGCNPAPDEPGKWMVATRLTELPESDLQRLQHALGT